MALKKPPLVLLHPATSSGRIWQDVVPLVSDHHAVQADFIEITYRRVDDVRELRWTLLCLGSTAVSKQSFSRRWLQVEALASWYVYFFQLPGIPERALLGSQQTGARLSKLLQSYFKQTPEAADRDARAMAEPGVLTAALNWYRAIPLSDMRRIHHKIVVPTM